MSDAENGLVSKAKKYLKEEYGEDTVSMTVTRNTVTKGKGVLFVDCTVSIDGEESDWSKEFYFEAVEFTHMNCEIR